MIDDECAPRGYMIVLRALWDSKLFRPGPFTEREAFFWMMKEAYYADERSWINGIGFDLRRGQFVHGCAFMAKAWNWMTPKGKPNEKQVERFLKRLVKNLKKGGMGGTLTLSHLKSQSVYRVSVAP